MADLDELIERSAARMAADWDQLLDNLLVEWEAITVVQRSELQEQVRTAVESNNVELLASLTVSQQDATDLLHDYLNDMYERGEAQVRSDAADQGVDVSNLALVLSPVNLLTPDVIHTLLVLASTIVSLLADGLCGVVAREILRLWGSDPDPDSMASRTGEYIDGLSDRALRDQLGGGLTNAMNSGRFSAMLTANPSAWYATERNDPSACKPCRNVDGTRFNSLAAATAAYPAGGYLNCEGGVRCRGGVVPVWEAS